MTGHTHDLDLVAGLAGGLLHPEEEEAALQLVASCDVCRSEHAVHQRIREGLAGLPPVALTESERELVVAATRRRSFRPGPILAAAAAVVVVVVGIITALDDDHPTTLAAPPSVVELGDVSAGELAAELDRLVAHEAATDDTEALLMERAEPETAPAPAADSAAGSAEEETPPPTPPCEAPLGSTTTVLAVVDGRGVVAFVSADGAILLDADTCAPISTP